MPTMINDWHTMLTMIENAEEDDSVRTRVKVKRKDFSCSLERWHGSQDRSFYLTRK